MERFSLAAMVPSRKSERRKRGYPCKQWLAEMRYPDDEDKQREFVASCRNIRWGMGACSDDPAPGEVWISVNEFSLLMQFVEVESKLRKLDRSKTKARTIANDPNHPAYEYADKILNAMALIDNHHEHGNVTQFWRQMAIVESLYKESNNKIMMPYAEPGYKTKRGGPDGAIARWGVPEVRKTKRRQRVEAYIQALITAPDKQTAKLQAAEKCGVVKRTIERAIKEES